MIMSFFLVSLLLLLILPFSSPYILVGGCFSGAVLRDSPGSAGMSSIGLGFRVEEMEKKMETTVGNI